MEEIKNIDIWLVGNTGLRNPIRIYDGFKAFANSQFVGKLHGLDNEIGFMNLLNEQNIIQNKKGKDASGSHARKWRLMFAKNGFIFPVVAKKHGSQSDLGPIDEITPFGKIFLNASNPASIQDCFLRSMVVEQYVIPNMEDFFSPLRWILSIMLELEKRTGSTEISRLEFALWGQTTNPSYDLSFVVDKILDLRQRRTKSASKRVFDKEEINERSKLYKKQKTNFFDYCDMNMRYLRITGILQRKGRGLMIVPSKHALATNLASPYACTRPIFESYKMLCNGTSLPEDDLQLSQQLLNNVICKLDELNIDYDCGEYDIGNPLSVKQVRIKLENILANAYENIFAHEQPNQWREISKYMELLINGGGRYEYNEDYIIEVPKEETSAYFEWTLWRAILAIGELKCSPNHVRRFNVDSDFFPISTAAGGQGDLYCEFEDFVFLTEVTMSTGSRQEAMEGEPVRRHVSDEISKNSKPVFCLFLANKVDTNTAETFRHGVWYTKGNIKQRLNIIPLSLKQFQRFFISLFETNNAHPSEIKSLIQECELQRDNLDAPSWMEYIDDVISKKILEVHVN